MDAVWMGEVMVGPSICSAVTATSEYINRGTVNSKKTWCLMKAVGMHPLASSLSTQQYCDAEETH